MRRSPISSQQPTWVCSSRSRHTSISTMQLRTSFLPSHSQVFLSWSLSRDSCRRLFEIMDWVKSSEEAALKSLPERCVTRYESGAPWQLGDRRPRPSSVGSVSARPCLTSTAGQSRGDSRRPVPRVWDGRLDSVVIHQSGVNVMVRLVPDVSFPECGGISEGWPAWNGQSWKPWRALPGAREGAHDGPDECCLARRGPTCRYRWGAGLEEWAVHGRSGRAAE